MQYENEKNVKKKRKGALKCCIKLQKKDLLHLVKAKLL